MPTRPMAATRPSTSGWTATGTRCSRSSGHPDRDPDPHRFPAGHRLPEPVHRARLVPAERLPRVGAGGGADHHPGARPGEPAPGAVPAARQAAGRLVAHVLLRLTLGGVGVVLIGTVLLIFDVVLDRRSAVIAAAATGLVLTAIAVLPHVLQRMRPDGGRRKAQPCPARRSPAPASRTMRCTSRSAPKAGPRRRRRVSPTPARRGAGRWWAARAARRVVRRLDGRRPAQAGQGVGTVRLLQQEEVRPGPRCCATAEQRPPPARDHWVPWPLEHVDDEVLVVAAPRAASRAVPARKRPPPGPAHH